MSFKVDTVPIHIHERTSPHNIIENIKRKVDTSLTDFFDTDENNLPYDKQIEFYEHEQGWANRMIAGDSLLVMNSLLRKERMRSKVQMIYFDPPYGINYSSNFQPYTNKTDVKDGKGEDLTKEPEQIKAYRDTWELDEHSYLTYIRNRLLLSRELLTDSGSIFIQISDEHVHRIRVIMDEIFGSENFVSLITFKKSNNSTSSTISNISDYIIWYAKDKKQIKYNALFTLKGYDDILNTYNQIELPDGTRRPLTKKEKDTKNIPKGKLYYLTRIESQHESKKDQKFEFKGKIFEPSKNKQWSVNIQGLKNLIKKNRLIEHNNKIVFIRYLDDFPVKNFTNVWIDTIGGMGDDGKVYTVQTITKTIQRCMLMTTDPGDLVFDPTCGSGTTAYVSEKYGRRWITCDTSRVALNLAQRRLTTALFDYYKLVDTKQGVCNGFVYDVVNHIIPKTLAYNEDTPKEILYDKPHIDKTKKRVSGPFTIEAIPAPEGKSIYTLNKELEQMNTHESYITEWQNELANSYIRLYNNKRLEFTDIGLYKNSKWIHCTANTKEDKPRKAIISFGPPHAPITVQHIENTLKDASNIKKPILVIFAAMQFDTEAIKTIKYNKKIKRSGIDIIQVNMNTDLLVKDLKKSDGESFWQVGQPDVKIEKQDGKYIVQVLGYDYYNTQKRKSVTGDTSDISMWMLDTNYNGRYVQPDQIFFTKNVGNNKNEILKLGKLLKGVINEEKLQAYIGTESIPFTVGDQKRIAVKVIDNKGISTIDVIDVE